MIISKEQINKIRQLEKRYNAQGVKQPICVSQAPYTFVTVKYGDKKGVGFAKCSPRDKYDENIGFNIAVARAIKDAIGA